MKNKNDFEINLKTLHYLKNVLKREDFKYEI